MDEAKELPASVLRRFRCSTRWPVLLDVEAQPLAQLPELLCQDRHGFDAEPWQLITPSTTIQQIRLQGCDGGAHLRIEGRLLLQCLEDPPSPPMPSECRSLME